MGQYEYIQNTKIKNPATVKWPEVVSEVIFPS